MDTPLEISSNNDNPKYMIVKFVGNLDSYGLTEKRKDIDQLVTDCNKPFLVFDFSELEYINSESIGLLMRYNEILMAKEQKLVLLQAKQNVIDVLEVIGLLETVPYYASMEDFLKVSENAN